MPAQEFARTISSDMECEFGVRIFAKKLNLPHTTCKFWLKGILIKIPEAAVKAQIVADLVECGFNGDKVRLAEKLNLQAKQVWVSEKTREHEKKTYPEEALEWIKNHGQQYHVECCNSIIAELTAAMKIYGKDFSARWGPKAEIREMPSWDNTDFSLTIANEKNSRSLSHSTHRSPRLLSPVFVLPSTLSTLDPKKKPKSSSSSKQFARIRAVDFSTTYSTPDTTSPHAYRNP